MRNEFSAKLEKLEGKIPWTVFYVPFSVMDEFETKGRVDVKTIIDGYPYEGVLLPSRNGHYLTFNKELQKITGKTLGDLVHVTLTQNEKPSVLIIPELIQKKLTDYNLLESFNKLPNYIKKEEVNKIIQAKQDTTKLNRLEKLLEKLSKNPQG